MRRVRERVEIETTLAEAWETYFDRDRWGSWVDGFDGIDDERDGYPESGGRLVWRSLPQGRGRVSERVLEHEPRRLHRLAYTDEFSEGEMTTTFSLEGGTVRVEQALDYELRDRGAFSRLTDLLFIRREMQSSLARTLARLRVEVADRVPPGRAA